VTERAFFDFALDFVPIQNELAVCVWQNENAQLEIDVLGERLDLREKTGVVLDSARAASGGLEEVRTSFLQVVGQFSQLEFTDEILFNGYLNCLHL